MSQRRRPRGWVVNQTFAKKYLGTLDRLGQRDRLTASRQTDEIGIRWVPE